MSLEARATNVETKVGTGFCHYFVGNFATCGWVDWAGKRNIPNGHYFLAFYSKNNWRLEVAMGNNFLIDNNKVGFYSWEK